MEAEEEKVTDGEETRAANSEERKMKSFVKAREEFPFGLEENQSWELTECT